MGFLLPSKSILESLRESPFDKSNTLTSSMQTGLNMNNEVSFATDSAPVIFEPVVNTPALLAFSLISVAFSLLFLRITSISNASDKRIETLEKLRLLKSQQLDTGSNVSDEEVRVATESYRSALENELALRTIIPGIRIVAPNDPKKIEEEISAARQFLDIDLTSENIDYQSAESADVANLTEMKQEKSRTDLLMQSRRRMDGRNDDRSIDVQNDELPMSNSSRFVLILVALTQIALFWFLSLDPMLANDVLSNLDSSQLSLE